jgi:hypothetical protein
MSQPDNDRTSADTDHAFGDTGDQDKGSDSTHRPSGTSRPENYTGVDPQGPIDPESPTLQPGG